MTTTLQEDSLRSVPAMSLSILHPSSRTKTEWFEILLAWCEKNWKVPNRHGNPRRPPNAYILCRRWAGEETARGWKKFSPAERQFWKEIAAALQKEHICRFPNYVFKASRLERNKQPCGRSRPQRGSSISRIRQGLRCNSHSSGDASPASVSLRLSPLQEENDGQPEDGVPSGPTNTKDPCLNHMSTSPSSFSLETATSESSPQSSTSESPLAVYNRIRASYEESWETFNKHGNPKVPPNAFMVFKSAHRYGPRTASPPWKGMPEGEKRWWDEVATYVNQDHHVKFPDYKRKRIPAQGTNSRANIRGTTTAQHQHHQEPESSFSPQIPIGTVPPTQHDFTSYSAVDGYVPRQIMKTEESDGQEPQPSSSQSWDDTPQYQAAILPPGMQTLHFPAEHMESFPSLNLSDYSSLLTTPASDSQPVDFGFGPPAEPSDIFGTIDAEAEWLDMIFRLSPC